MVAQKAPAASPRTRRGTTFRAGAALGKLAGCPFHDIRVKLSEAGLRPTPQRIALGWLLFAKGDRHLTAEILHEEAQASRVTISLATIYNSLNQFSEAGLLREIAIDGARTYFDTNVSDHHHFLVESANLLIDIPKVGIDPDMLPRPPAGKMIASVDVIVHLRDEPLSGEAVRPDTRVAEDGTEALSEHGYRGR
ncbi:MAG TPA: Fur family transcriptional regulator [Methylocella sp.]|nr:Fur family transcriptional regulator [Methylocella sp.]